tara:strand:+ start:7724 stop:8740 length:1017 start_codon:yes stop_codon:yes gene_type:complete
MKRIVLYINSKSLNDATSHYIEIVNRAVTELGFVFLITESINDIKFRDIIFTITTNNYIKGFFLRPLSKTIFWSQGIDPEESMMREKNIFKYYLKSFIEYIVLSLPSFKLFVSNAMLNHYKNKYNFNAKSYTTMPCYNLHYSEPLQNNLNRYKNPSFVYAGSLSIWQNIDETLQVYKCLENHIQNSTLTLLTEEIEKANNLIEKHNIKSANVKYVDLRDLNNELLKYKYGFLLRRNNIVNNVATPTKMNSYLACGLIPIFTDAITDYKDQIDLKDFSLRISSNLSVDEIAKKIIDFESSKKDYSNLDIEIKKIFDKYYNDIKYTKEIKLGLKEYLSIK